MTRAFRTSEPKVYDTEGIKCYALCPTFADTNLVRGAMTDRKENPNEEMGFKSGRGNITTIEQLEKSTKMRVMSVHEIGDAMMKSLKYDKVGTPNWPLAFNKDSNNLYWRLFSSLSVFSSSCTFGNLPKKASSLPPKVPQPWSAFTLNSF